jgi:hypothetical protein
MYRIGIEPRRIAAVVAALLIAIAGIATVMAQALGPAGPSPAGENAEVVAQALVELPEGDAVWRIRNLRVDEAELAVSDAYPAFIMPESIPLLVIDTASGIQQRVAAGEAATLAPGHETILRSLGPRQTVLAIDVLPVEDATLSGSSGSIGDPFEITAGTYDVDVIRIKLNEAETSTVPMGNGPSQLVAIAGQAEIEADDESFNMAAGADRTASGDVTITARTDATVIVVVRLGPQIDTGQATPAPVGTPASSPAASPAAATPDTAVVSSVLETVTSSPTPAAPPQDIDSDGDGIVNSAEIGAGLDPDNPDTDGDGLLDGEEPLAGTDPLNPDTDDDGMNDGQEVDAGTNPLSSDTDGDVLYDGGELLYGSDPLNPDTDGDGLIDGDEIYFYQTSPTSADTDGDGVSDYNEVVGGAGG